MSLYSHEDCWSDEAQHEIKNTIATLLGDKNLLLISGAGFSKNFGYPRWKEFLDQINKECGADVKEADYEVDGILDYLKYAQAIYDKSPTFDFNAYIEKCFDQVNCKKPIPDYYEMLIDLGFRGFATLNYDYTLEIIISQLKKGEIFRVNTIDFCDTDRESKIRKFLDNVSEKKDEFGSVLHLHGTYEKPSNIILTQGSYEKWYENGSITKLLESISALKEILNKEPTIDAYEKITGIERRIQIIYQGNVLQSLHKKIIWSLFARYRIFFIGFSADDTFFMNLLNVVIEDFTLPRRKPSHFVLVSCDPTGDDDEKRKKDDICKKMFERGVLPIFYPVKDSDYEKGLSEFILEISSRKKKLINENKVSQTSINIQSKKPALGKTIDEITAFTKELK